MRSTYPRGRSWDNTMRCAVVDRCPTGWSSCRHPRWHTTNRLSHTTFIYGRNTTRNTTTCRVFGQEHRRAPWSGWKHRGEIHETRVAAVTLYVFWRFSGESILKWISGMNDPSKKCAFWVELQTKDPFQHRTTFQVPKGNDQCSKNRTCSPV